MVNDLPDIDGLSKLGVREGGEIRFGPEDSLPQSRVMRPKVSGFGVAKDCHGNIKDDRYDNQPRHGA
jgi:hypothetical protein